MGAPKKFEIETACINQLMVGGAYDVEVLREAQVGMREAGVFLPDVHYVGSTGRVIRSGMLGNRGLWVVRGATIDGVLIDITVSVVSTEYEVEVREVCAVQMRGRK